MLFSKETIEEIKQQLVYLFENKNIYISFYPIESSYF